MRVTIRIAYHAFGLSINILAHDSFVVLYAKMNVLCATPVVHIGLLARFRIGLLSSIVINVRCKVWAFISR